MNHFLMKKQLFQVMKAAVPRLENHSQADQLEREIIRARVGNLISVAQHKELIDGIAQVRRIWQSCAEQGPEEFSEGGWDRACQEAYCSLHADGNGWIYCDRCLKRMDCRLYQPDQTWEFCEWYHHDPEVLQLD